MWRDGPAIVDASSEAASIALARPAPGLKGLKGGMEPHHTPWDGANGIVDPQTGVFFSAVGFVRRRLA